MPCCSGCRLPPACAAATWEAVRDQRAHCGGHIAFAREALADPVADAACLCDAAANIGERQAPHHRVIFISEDQERIGQVAALVLGVALSRRRKAPRVRSSDGQVGSHGTRKLRLAARNAAHSAKSPLCGARKITPAPVMPGMISLKLTVRKSAMDVRPVARFRLRGETDSQRSRQCWQDRCRVRAPRSQALRG